MKTAMSMAADGGTLPDRLLRIRDVAALLGVSERTVWRLMAEGELPQPVLGRGGSRLPVGVRNGDGPRGRS